MICKDREAGPASVPPARPSLLRLALGTPCFPAAFLVPSTLPGCPVAMRGRGVQSGGCRETHIWPLFSGYSWFPGE